jgi:hypothetical protein
MVVKRLTQKHDGQYLAKVTADCLDWSGLAELVCLSFFIFYFAILSTLQVHSVCMDNASNCDGTAKHLPLYVPTFRGMASRGRCFPHIINLIAKVRFHFSVDLSTSLLVN